MDLGRVALETVTSGSAQGSASQVSRPDHFIPFRFPGVPGVSCAFSTRQAGSLALVAASVGEVGGACAVAGCGAAPASNHAAAVSGEDENMLVRERRRQLAANLGVSSFAEVRQVHGTRTIFEPEAQSPDFMPEVEADGLATSAAGLALMIKTADCQPILLAHTSGLYVAALHSGWRGNRQNYPGLAVAEFCERYHLRPEDVCAVRGPSLGPSAAEFIHFNAEWGSEFLPWFDAAAQTMNLWSLTRDQLLAAGLRSDRVYGLDLCTWSMPETFFSYRRFRYPGQGAPLPDGRQGSFIWREAMTCP